MAKLADLRAREQELAGLLRDVRRLTKGSGTRDIAAERAADRKRKAEERKLGAAVYIPRPKNDKRRKRLEKDVFKWLRWYFADIFTEDFQAHHREMIQAILSACKYAGDQAIAAPRGEGKTTITECVVIYATLCGLLQFSVIFAATASDAENSLKSIKDYIHDSARLAEDYPGICVPIHEVDASPQKAHSIVVYGDDFPISEARFQWSGNEISIPNVPGLACASARIATRGLDSAVRGLKKGTQRPQLAIIDDPDTEDSARSEEQIKKLSDRIERAIAGLAPRGKRMSRVMLTTLQNRTCASAMFTDPKLKPSWKGKRFAFLKKPPDRVDLWEEYVSMRRQSGTDADEFARMAHRFYLTHRNEMDAGAEAANPSGFDGRKLPDGSQLEVSAIQRYYDFVADNGEDSAQCELQNDPPEESGPIESGITAYRIQRQVSGYERKSVPPGCAVVTQGIDCRKVALHRVVRAWRPDGTGYTIDYGVQEVLGTTVGSDEGLDVALVRALQAVADFMRSGPYRTPDGVEVPIALTLVDAGWRTEAIYHGCKELGLGWMPAMGFGKSNGCVQTRFAPPVHSSADRKTGDGWFLSRRPKGVWLVCMDSDRWKAWEHDRWMTPTDKPGTMFLFGESGTGDRMSFDEKGHFSYSKHLTAEIEIEAPVKGVLLRRWKAKSDTNHYLDASYMADVAANMKGIALLRASPQGQQQKQQGGGWFARQKSA